MTRSRHACIIDRLSTTVVEIDFDLDDAPDSTRQKTISVGTRHIMGEDQGRALRKIGDLLKKMKAKKTSLCIHPDRFYPFDALFARILDKEALEAQCRTEAGYFLRNPDNYSCETIPYCSEKEGSPFSKHLLLLYPRTLLSSIRNGLEPWSDIDATLFYLKPLVSISAMMEKKLCLLELEADYAAFSVSANGKIEYYRYWELQQPGEAEYFALHELKHGRPPEDHEVHVTGVLTENNVMMERLKKASAENLLPLDPSEIMPEAVKWKKNMKTPAVLKALAMILETPSDTA